MSRCVDFVFLCLFLVVEPLTGKIQTPQNLSLSWVSDFEPQLTWTPPPHSMENCSYTVKSQNTTNRDIKIPVWSKVRAMEGGKLNLSVQTVCGQEESDWVSITTPYPELVENFQCFLESSQLTYCTWDHAPNTQDLRFYYLLAGKFVSSGIKSPLTECSSYRNNRSGCNLKAETSYSMWVLLNGTVGNETARNTFNKTLRNFVKPLPLDWNVTKKNNFFLIEWRKPEINDKWTWRYMINFIRCNEEHNQSTSKTSCRLEVQPECPYRIRIKAEHDDDIGTPWSKYKDFDAETNPNKRLWALIILPLVVAGLVLFMFMCYRKNKDRIFPKIPEPRDLLSDISDNSNKSNQFLHVEEEDTCKITLVMDPHTEKNIS